MLHQDNSASYFQYVDTQTQLNANKFERTSLTIEEVRAINAFYRSKRNDLLRDERFFALCHGVRNGAETRAFTKCFGQRVIGTDISISILRVPDGFLCDFSDSPKLWDGKVDFLYSNSYDHAQDLDYTLAAWNRLLSPRGMMFLQFTPEHAIDMGLSFSDLQRKLEQRGFLIEKVIDLKPAGGLVVALDTLYNIARKMCNVLARIIFPKSSRFHWYFSYTLRRGTTKETNIVAVSKAQ